jgi:hypothetical protein
MLIHKIFLKRGNFFQKQKECAMKFQLVGGGDGGIAVLDQPMQKVSKSWRGDSP